MRRYKTSYKSKRGLKRFTVDFAGNPNPQPSRSCAVCGYGVEDVMRGELCYSCNREMPAKGRRILANITLEAQDYYFHAQPPSVIEKVTTALDLFGVRYVTVPVVDVPEPQTNPPEFGSDEWWDAIEPLPF